MFAFTPPRKPGREKIPRPRKPGEERPRKPGEERRRAKPVEQTENLSRLRRDTPWATRAITSRRDGTLIRLEPVHKERPTPWHPADLEYLRPPLPVEVEPAPAKARPPSTRFIGAQNYAAVEAGAERYGLIDAGPSGQGRSLIVHVRKNQVAWPILNPIRPGAILRARPASGGPAGELRVRYTTPAGYFSPGKKVSTLAIGVDESDWRSLVSEGPGTGDP